MLRLKAVAHAADSLASLFQDNCTCRVIMEECPDDLPTFLLIQTPSYIISCNNLQADQDKCITFVQNEMIMSKVDKYVALIPRIQSVLSGETDEIARMSNMAALLHFEFGFWWTGFYRVVSADELVLGPFQGPVACTRIKKGRGVCGTSWREERTLVVPDVEQFPGHIACSSESRSEIVVPCRKCGQIVAVLDIDSKELATFDEIDRDYLEQIVSMLYGKESQTTL